MKWGILAAGTIAAKFARTVNAMTGEGETLVAIGSRNIEKAKGFAGEHGIPKAYGSYEELAADPEVEAIYIATPAATTVLSPRVHAASASLSPSWAEVLCLISEFTTWASCT
jgi:predicted dehydrogenase